MDKVLEILRDPATAPIVAILTLILTAWGQFRPRSGFPSVAANARRLFALLQRRWKLPSVVLRVSSVVVVVVGFVLGYLYGVEWRQDQMSTDRIADIVAFACFPLVGGIAGIAYVVYAMIWPRTLIGSLLGLTVAFIIFFNISIAIGDVPFPWEGVMFSSWLFGLFLSLPLLPWAARGRTRLTEDVSENRG